MATARHVQALFRSFHINVAVGDRATLGNSFGKWYIKIASKPYSFHITRYLLYVAQYVFCRETSSWDSLLAISVNSNSLAEILVQL